MIISEKQIYIDRFMKKINKKDCWEWMGCVSTGGYGQFVFNGKMQGAHRVSWQIHKDNIPNGLCVLHKCDNRKCVNPEHLFIGTHKENTNDMMKKDRGALKYGEKHPYAKLEEKDIKEIFNLSGLLSQREIAKKFNVSQGLIQRILKHKAWKSFTSSLQSMSKGGVGSNQKGSKASRAKLSEEQALYIFKMKGHKTRYELADKFDVAEVSIRKIWGKQTWTHITCQQSEELKAIE